MLVDGLEVCHIECHFLAKLETGTEAYGVGVRHETHIANETAVLAKSIMGGLPTGADRPTLCHVPFGTCQDFPSAIMKVVVTVFVLGGLFVKIVVEATVETYVVEHFVLCANRKDCGNVGLYFLSIVVFVQSARIDTGTVLQTQTRLEFVTGRKVESAGFVVHTDNGRETKTCLVAIEFFILYKCREVGHSLTFEELRCRNCCGSLDLHANVAHITIVVTVGINYTSTHAYIEVWKDFITYTKLSTEIVLATLHMGVHAITGHSIGRYGSYQSGQKSHLTFKRRESVGEVTFSTAAGYTEME